MKYEATVSFVGDVCMMKGEARELKSSLAKPLVDCGYLKPIRKAAKNENKRTNTESNPEPS